MSIEKTNAQRFITAYNIIDHSLRAQYNFKRSMSFSDIIRRSVAINYIVRKYEDELIDYGRLRNAIIHKSNDEYIIAEPHGEVVINLEKIARLISTPPLAIEVVGRNKVICSESNKTIRDIIKLIAETNYSNIPIYSNNELIGIANGQRILDKIGRELLENKSAEIFINNTKIIDILSKNHVPYNYYEILNEKVTIETVLERFYINPKLMVILLTPNGTNKERPTTIITTGDIINFNKTLDNY